MSAFFKDVYREILYTKGRFFGLLAIVALGVAFYAGLGATGYDMKLTGDLYFDAQHLMDIRVVSTYGLNNNDIQAIRQTEGVAYTCATYSMDAQSTNNGYTGNIKLHSYEADAKVNKPLLISGRLPEANGECVVEAGLLSRMGYSIGDRITLESGKSSDIRNKLRNRTYTITGVVVMSSYISRERGTSSIGRGEVDFYMLIPSANFLSEVYTEAFVIVDGAETDNSFTDTYKERVKAVRTAIEDIGKIRIEERTREMTANAYTRLSEAEKALAQNNAETQLLMAEAQVQINDAMNAQVSASASLSEMLTDIVLQEREIETGLAQVTSGLAAARDAEIVLDEQESSLYASRREVMEYEVYLGAEFNERMRDIDDGLHAVTSARAALAEQKNALYRQFDVLVESKYQIREALNAVYDGDRTLSTGKYALSVREAELAAERLTLLNALDEARTALDATRKQLNDLDDPKWYVLDRDANPGYSSYSDDTNKITAIGQVFPLIFFIVAALVCLTSMTRLVEERRTEIGTLKSLGYGNTHIMIKYIVYALLPTLIGGGVGGYIGMMLFPQTIITAYNMLYTTPAPVTPMHPFYWSLGLVMGLSSTGIATVYACIHTLRESPGNLLRPKPPKTGKRILFERIPFFWRRLKFIQKVTIRNLLRYKKRLYMTIIGIGGCTALLLTGFGLRDSIADIIFKQFEELNLYNMVVSFTDSASEKQVSHANDVLTGNPLYRRSLIARQKSMDISGADGGNQYQAALIIPEDADRLGYFFSLRDRATHTNYTLNDNGVIITEKLSNLLNVKPNDMITIRDGDDTVVHTRVAAVVETYFMHYIYMSPNEYERLFGEQPVYNTLYAIVNDSDTADSSELARILLDEKGVNGVSFIRSMINTFNNIIENLNFVVIILIVSAGALALVVLLNLTSININERLRELATIEVLGFYDMEVDMYVYRENAILTIIGAVLGLGLGYFLHLYVILTAETDIMMFGRDIKPLSFVFSLALTFCFALAVNLLTANRLKKIDMVEALKSME